MKKPTRPFSPWLRAGCCSEREVNSAVTQVVVKSRSLARLQELVGFLVPF